MLSFRNYAKRYNGRLIVSIDNLELGKGIHWIKGANGSGKSTLFKSISGLIPFEGEISLEQFSLAKNPISFRKLVNYAEAEPVYPGFLTAKDLVRFVGRCKNASRAEQEELIAHLGVNEYFHLSCGTFSSGMLKKLSLTLGFLGKPRVIILDEPFITLDQASHQKLVALIRTVVENGVMVLISSHQEIDHDLALTSTFVIQNQQLVHA